MERLKSVIRNNTAFLFPCLVFWAGGVAALLLWDKISVQIFLNAGHTPFQDDVWMHMTALGGTFFVVCALLAGSLFSCRFMVGGTAAILLAMGITTLLKYAIEMPRPSVVLSSAGLLGQVGLVEGYPLRQTLSFPSGHTTAAFCMFTLFALFARKGWVKSLLFFLALAVGYSRIYLMQHFLSDVLAGSVIGTLSAVGLYAYVKGARWIDFGRPLVSRRRYGTKGRRG